MQNEQESDQESLSRKRRRARRKMKEKGNDARFSAHPKRKKQVPESQREARAMISKMHEMHGDLEEKIRFIQDRIHLLPEPLQKLAADPQCYLKEHLEILEKFEKDLKEEMITILGSENLPPSKKEESKDKKKNRRARPGKKGWISLE